MISGVGGTFDFIVLATAFFDIARGDLHMLSEM
jgi:hypothetical protein